MTFSFLFWLFCILQILESELALISIKGGKITDILLKPQKGNIPVSFPCLPQGLTQRWTQIYVW